MRRILSFALLSGIICVGMYFLFLFSRLSLWTSKSGASKEKSGVEEGKRKNERGGEPADRQVRLTSEQMNQFGVQLAQGGPGRIQLILNLPGEIAINADRISHIVPRVTGVVKEVRKSLGDSVRKDEILAVLESRELADGKAAFLAAQQRLILAEGNYLREEQLWKKRISAEQDYFQAKNQLAEVRIELQTAGQKLQAMGLTEEQMLLLPKADPRELIRYEMTAPFDATIIEKHIDLGEVLKEDTPGFKIADLTAVWALLDVHQRDVPRIKIGQSVMISSGQGSPEATVRISYIEPMVNEQTRTLHARAILENLKGQWQPGMFVTGQVIQDTREVALLIPNEAIILLEDKPSVFVRTEQGGFRPQPVTLGLANEAVTEILRGLSVGQTFVAKGAFILKSEWDKPAAEE